jgi:hypothetical protein
VPVRIWPTIWPSAWTCGSCAVAAGVRDIVEASSGVAIAVIATDLKGRA